MGRSKGQKDLIKLSPDQKFKTKTLAFRFNYYPKHLDEVLDKIAKHYKRSKVSQAEIMLQEVTMKYAKKHNIDVNGGVS